MTNPTDKKCILIIDDDVDLTEILRVYFERQGYEVFVASHGEDALDMIHNEHPHIILLDVVLPGMDGYEVCREIRQTTATCNIPIIFLTIKSERADRIAGLELGADDYITKPFEIDELALRTRNAIDRAEREIHLNPTDPMFPDLRVIKHQLRDLQTSTKLWTFIDLKIENYNSFCEVYGNLAGGEVTKLFGRTITEVIDELGTQEDFVGYPGSNNFVIISYSVKPDQLINTLVKRFNADVLLHYSVKDRQQQYIVLPSGEKCPLMTLSAKSTQQFPIEGFEMT